MRNKIIACAFALTVLFGWAIYHTVNSNIGQIVEIKVSGYDPRDLLSGHYLTYTVDYDNFKHADCRNFQSEPAVYLCLAIGKLSAKKPADCLAVKGICRYSRFVAGIERFYIPQDYAPKLDAALRAGKHDAKIKVLITRGGKTYVKDMFFDGISAKDFARR